MYDPLRPRLVAAPSTVGFAAEVLEVPMPRVFVSHSSYDRSFVEEELIPLLNSHGIDTWYSRDDLVTASYWERCIRESLEACDWFLVVASPHALASDWVRAEVHWAMQHRQGRVVPVLLQDCDISGLHLQLIRIQFVDYRTDRESARTMLLRVWHTGTPKERPDIPSRCDAGPLDLAPAERAFTGRSRLSGLLRAWRRAMYVARARHHAAAGRRRDTCPQCMRQLTLSQDPDFPDLLRCSGASGTAEKCGFRYSKRLHALPRINISLFGPSGSGKTTYLHSLWVDVLRGVDLPGLHLTVVSDADAVSRLSSACNRYGELVRREEYCELFAGADFVALEGIATSPFGPWPFLLNIVDCPGGEYFGSEPYDAVRRGALLADAFLIFMAATETEGASQGIALSQIAAHLRTLGRESQVRGVRDRPVALCLSKIDVLEGSAAASHLLRELWQSRSDRISLAAMEQTHREWEKLCPTLLDDFTTSALRMHFGPRFRVFPLSIGTNDAAYPGSHSCGMFEPILWILHESGYLNVPSHS